MALKAFYRIAKNGGIRWVGRSQIDALYYARADLFVGTVLDAGCGKKPWHHIKLDKCRYIGVDLSLSELLANEEVDSRICADANFLPLRDASVNLVICQDLVEHLTDPGRFVGEVGRVLAPGGRFMINTPGLYGGVSPIGKLLPRFLSEFAWKMWKKREMPDYPFVYKANTKRAWHRLASSSGLVVESVFYINWIPHWFHSSPVLATMMWAYGELVSRIRADFLRSYMVVILGKDG